MKCVDLSNDIFINTDAKQRIFFKGVANEIKYELSQFGYTNAEVADILVKFLYYIKPSKHKDVLWFCYGGYIVDNLKRNFNQRTKIIQCCDCGEWFEIDTKDNETCRCKECYSEYRKIYYREKKREQRLKLKMSTAQSLSVDN